MSTCHDRAQKYRNDSRSNDELIQLVLTKDADADNDEYWHPVWILQHRLPEIIELVRKRVKIGDAKLRETAATILGQNGVKDKLAVNECVDLLLGMIRPESDDAVLSSIAHAIGHLHDPRCIEALLSLEQHPNADVRYAVVHGLSGYDDLRAIKALIRLSADQDRDVRDWATFGIGSMIEKDIPEIREALLARLTEADDEIRGEALAGLAQRGETRIVATLLQELKSPPDVLRKWELIGITADSIIRSATTSGDEKWLPALEKMKTMGVGDSTAIQSAIERCTPKHP
ncbi:MAG TPA: HEAT repeat domain-containing protein [Candidatus Acidoferrales bacterium]|jgi:HEAT repeat protein|nr:HEAT repeat domain-containing protein [Candidatus Acidoferrales bacterium]